MKPFIIECGIIHNRLQALVYLLSLKWLPPVGIGWCCTSCMGLISSRRVHEGEKRRTSAGEDLDVFIVGIIIIIIFQLLTRLHLARGRSSGLVGSACGRYGMRHSEERKIVMAYRCTRRGLLHLLHLWWLRLDTRRAEKRCAMRTYNPAGVRRLHLAGLSI